MSRDRRALRVFAAALALSLAAHLSLLGVPAWWPAAPDEPPVIEARLEVVQPPPPAVEPPPPPPRPAAKRRTLRRAPPPAQTPEISPLPATPEPAPAVSPVPEPVVAVAPPDMQPAPAAAEPEPGEEQAVAEELAPAATRETAAPAVPAPDGPPLERQMPRRGRIVYAFYYGGQRLHVGQSVAEWEVRDGRYTLKSVTETTGVAGFFKPLRVVHSSEGRITERGLRPESFSVLKESRTRRLDSAQFDWEAMRLRFGGGQDARVTALLPETQDLLSFIHQLSLIRLGGHSLYLNITNGRKLGTYEVQVLGEELVETPLGRLRSTHLKQVPSRGEEGVEVWLAADYGNLPVRVRYTDRQGDTAGEQLAQEIWVES